MKSNLPKAKKDVFFYEMALLFTAMDLRLFKKFPKGLIQSLTTEEVSSLLATLIVEVD